MDTSDQRPFIDWQMGTDSAMREERVAATDGVALMVQFMTAREQVDAGHRARGEPTYAELQAQRDALLAVLERAYAGEAICSHPEHWCGNCDDWDVHTELCQSIRTAIALVKGER